MASLMVASDKITSPLFKVPFMLSGTMLIDQTTTLKLTHTKGWWICIKLISNIITWTKLWGRKSLNKKLEKNVKRENNRYSENINHKN